MSTPERSLVRSRRKQQNLREALEEFLQGCDATNVMVYGPYPPTRGRTRWRIQLYDNATKRKKSLTAPSQAEAEAMIPFLQAELRKHAPLMLHDAIGQYLDFKKAMVQEHSAQIVVDSLLAFLPNAPVSQITPQRAEDLYTEQTKRIGKFGIIKAATHHALLRRTKEFFRWLIKRGLASSNPFENVDPIGRANAGKSQPRETDALKLDALLFEQARAGDEGALALLVQIYLGMRSGEVLALLVGAVEREGLKVSVVRGKSKNAKRGLELYPEVAELLWAHCKGRPDAERVFAAQLPQKPKTNWMYKRLHQRCKELGLPKFCPHSLRGLHSSLALTNGATTHAVAAGLGHASFATTAKHYADPSAVDNAKVKRVVGVLRRGASASIEADVKNLSPADKALLLELLKAP